MNQAKERRISLTQSGISNMAKSVGTLCRLGHLGDEEGEGVTQHKADGRHDAAENTVQRRSSHDRACEESFLT